MIDFGAWVEGKLSECGSDAQALSAESGLLYAYLNRLFNSGKKGRPIRPDQKTVIQIGEGLVKIGAIEHAGDAEIAAGYIPKGYKIIREADLTAEPPENFEDWPPELREALAHARTLTPEAQTYIYKLWREQSRAHADIETMRQEAERQLIERQRELDLLK